MPANATPIEIFVGDTPSFIWNMLLPGGGNTPLSAPTGRFLITQDLSLGPDLVTKTALPMVNTAGLWSLSVSLLASDTATLPVGRWLYQTQVLDTGGVKQTVAQGFCDVRPTR